MQVIWSPNPRGKRRSKRKMSAKQRKYFGKRSKRRASPVAVSAAPVKHRRRRSAARVARRTRRAGRRSFMSGFSRSGAIGMLKAGAIGGAGAVAIDIAMAQAAKFLPASMATPSDGAGQPQYGYYAAKAGLAVLLGTYGGKIPVVGRYAGGMAEGALTVLAYQFMRPMVAQSGLSLGAYMNPAPTQARPALGRVGAYVGLPVRAGSGPRGSRASQMLSMVDNVRRAA